MKVALVAVAAGLLTSPSNWLVRALLLQVRAIETGGSDRAGRWIGILERLIIFILVVTDHAEAAALVVTAKAILRFPEISGDEPHLNAEYVLIGSLASWLLAIGVGFATRSLLTLW